MDILLSTTENSYANETLPSAKFYLWAFSCKSGHGGQNFKYIRIKQIWSQMKAESLYFDNIKSKYKFSIFLCIKLVVM